MKRRNRSYVSEWGRHLDEDREMDCFWGLFKIDRLLEFMQWMIN